MPPRPVISHLRVTPRRFGAGAAATPLAARRAQTGARIRFTLSEDATVRILIRHDPHASKRHKPKHSHLFTRSLKAGNHAVRFTGTLDGLTYGPGGYRVYAVAVDSSGRRSKREFARYRIVGTR